MKTKLLGAAALVVLLGAAPASATTYTYEGGLYTTNYNPVAFGDRVTGTVTFAFDTSQFTGFIYYGPPFDITYLSLTSGNYTATSPDSFFALSNFFHLESGTIISWYAAGAVPCGGTSGCYISASGPSNFGVQDSILHQCNSCVLHPEFVPWLGAAHGPIGTWTMVVPSAVPGPVLGSGLPALMMLLALWQRWRRCDSSC